jgi:hypothetical protein
MIRDAPSGDESSHIVNRVKSQPFNRSLSLEANKSLENPSMPSNNLLPKPKNNSRRRIPTSRAPRS